MDIYIPSKYICKHTKITIGVVIKTIYKEPKSHIDIIGFNDYTIKYEDERDCKQELDELRKDLFNAYLDMKKEENLNIGY